MTATLVPRGLRPGEIDEVVAFIAAQQADPARRIAYVGTEVAALRAELGGLDPAWLTTARVLDRQTRLIGAVVTEWDEDLGRAWIVGPWVIDDGHEWMQAAAALLDAALATLPAGVTRHELAGEIDNRRLADLADRLGWTATEPNHLLLADADVVAGWPEPREGGEAVSLRPATAADGDALTVLHDAEFPDTYASAAQLVEGQKDGRRLTLIAETSGTGDVVGYTSGSVQDDGEGFIDFLVVDPAARRTGLGRLLTTTITRWLLARSPGRRVCLTVQDHRTAARSLYDDLGFKPAGCLVAYRSWT